MIYRIADVNVEMRTFGRTSTYSLPYMVKNGIPEIVIEPDYENVRKYLPNVNDEECEYLATGNSFYSQLLLYGGIKLHSSAVIMNGKAFLFTADCGVGKSTHTAIWRLQFGDENVRLINDDKPALRKKNGEWYAYGTPWCGKTGQNLNLSAPVAGIAVIERGEKNTIERFEGLKAITAVIKQVGKPRDPYKMDKMLTLVDNLLANVPVWKLRCNMDPEAAIVAYEAMSGEKWRK